MRDYQKLDAYIEASKENMLSMLDRWVRIPSVEAERSGERAPFGAEVRRMLDQALADTRSMGFFCEDFDGYAMHAKMGKGEKTLGILCHLDIVPAGDGWTRDPFRLTRDNGCVYGRGVVDDKGPAVATLFAMKAICDAGIPMRDGVRLILGCAEETGMDDMAYYTAHADLPDYGFSPDAEFPVINIEKGCVHLNLTAKTAGESGATIPVYELFAGERVNVAPGMAYAILGVSDEAALNEAVARIEQARDFDLNLEMLPDGRAKLTAHGIQVHASVPETGKNAAGMLLIALADLEAGGGSQAIIRALAEHIGLEGNGASLGIACADEISGGLTCNLGILRYDGQQLLAQLDIRYPICAEEARICGGVVLAFQDVPIMVQCPSSHGPHHVPETHPVVQGLLKAYHEVTGLPPKALAIGGGTYARCMPNTVAFGLTFPGDADVCHMPDEFINIDKLMLATRTIAHAIVELAGA